MGTLTVSNGCPVYTQAAEPTIDANTSLIVAFKSISTPYSCINYRSRDAVTHSLTHSLTDSYAFVRMGRRSKFFGIDEGLGLEEEIE